MRKLTTAHAAWDKFIKFWNRCHPTDGEYLEWVRQHVEILEFARYEVIAGERQRRENLYFICQGLLARAAIDAEMDRRVIYHVADKNKGLFTHYHPLAIQTPPGDIVALKKTIVIEIPFQAINLFDPVHEAMFGLVQVLGERSDHDYQLFSAAKSHRRIQNRYRSLYQTMPEYWRLLTIQQQADLLEISPTSLKNFKRELLQKKRPGR